MLRLPTTLYIAFADYGPKIGMGSTDFRENLDDAADALCDVEGLSGRDGRVFEISLDVASNQPESVRDVTDECVRIVRQRMFDRGLEAAE